MCLSTCVRLALDGYICQGIYFMSLRAAMARNRKPLTVEELFRVLADRTRLRLLTLMNGQEICVCYLVEALKTSQPKISRHLAYLRNSGIVAARREGRWMHYRIVPPSDPIAARILEEVQGRLAEGGTMRQDHARLVKTCCTRQKPVRLSKAPPPATLSRSDLKPATSISGRCRERDGMTRKN
jgi:ArsR family transcriptional regulator